MRLVYHIVFVICILAVATAACLHGSQHFSHPQDEMPRILFSALTFLAAVGILGFVTQFFARRTSQVLSSLFFGFLAGIMATNFVAEIISGTHYSSPSGYFISYGLMLIFFSLSVFGLMMPNNSPETKPFGHRSSATTDNATNTALPSFFR